MTLYRRILLAIELNEDSPGIARRAQALAAALAAQLELLHVVQYVPVEPMGESLMPAVQIEEELMSRARKQLAALAAEVGISEDCCRVEAGNVKSEIVRSARERSADLIIVSSRERHGPSILLNLTDDAVLHGAPCDVLAMRATRAR
ncbi:MAG: universal stress protein [Steroidobacteraceae bacterium]